MIECRGPEVGDVADFALGGEARGLMIGVLGGTKICHMTGKTVRSKAEIQTYGRVFMAALAWDGRMRAPKREPVRVIVRFLFYLLPPAHAVASFAVISHLTPMNVGMTFRTLHSDI